MIDCSEVRMPPKYYCPTCKLNNESDDVCKSHNAGQWSKCRYHERYRGTDKATPSGVALDDDVDAPLLSALPVGSRSVGEIAASGGSNPEFSEASEPKDLVVALYGGKITKRECQFHLTAAMATEGSSTKRALLKDTLDVVKDFDADAVNVRVDSQAAKEIVSNMLKHGKLVGSLMSAHHRVAMEFHLKLASIGKGTKTVYQLSTGEQVVPYTANEDISDVDMLHMVLVDWCYVVVVTGYLSLTESREVHRWASRELYLDPESCKCVYRATMELLRMHDADSSKSLCAIYTQHRDAVLTDVKRIAGFSGSCVPCADEKPTSTNGLSANERNSNQRIPGSKPGDTSLVCQFPRKGVCWPWTNGKACTVLTKGGKCVNEDWHGVCGKSYKEGNQKRACKGNHKAIDCPDH